MSEYDVTCWWCGVHPERMHDITRLGDAERRYLPEWPPGDHDHSVEPPTPGELLERGATRFDRIMEGL